MENKKKLVSLLTFAACSFAMLETMPANAELQRDASIYTPKGKNPIYVTDSIPFETTFYVNGEEHTANLYFGFKNDAEEPKNGYLEVHTETVFIFEFREDIPITANTVLDFGKLSVMDVPVKDETIDNHLYLDFTKNALAYAENCDLYDGTFVIPQYEGDSIHKGDTMMISVETGSDKSYYFFYDAYEYLFVGGHTYCKAFTGNRSIGEMVYEVSEEADSVQGKHCYTGHEKLISEMNQLTLPEIPAVPTTETTTVEEPPAEETILPSETSAVKQVSAVIGDADGDGVLDIVDITSINKSILGLGTVNRPDLADINQNHIIDSEDQLLVLKFILGTKH